MEYGITTVAGGVIAAWSLVAVALIALAVLTYVAVLSRARRGDLQEAVQAFRNLDIEAFRNLVSSDEDAFLRSNLAPGKFREIKRQRTWAALLYAWEAGKAASALAKVGQAAQRSSDPRVALSGIHVAESAFRLRVHTLVACPRLLLQIILPDRQLRSVPPLVDQFERTTETLLRLGRFSAAHTLVRSKSV